MFGAGTSLAQATVMPDGQVIVGGTLSNTVIICAHVAVLKHSSEAVYVRVKVYRFAQVWFVITSIGKPTTTTPLQLSDAVTSSGSAGKTSVEQFTVILAGQVIVGGMLSLTKICCMHEAVLPHASTAWYVRLIV